jgi:putative oxidoreductase
MLLNSEPVAADFGLLVLRAGTAGTLFWQHGWAKIDQFGDLMADFPDPLGIGSTLSLVLVTLAEAACAALVALGLWTRVSTVPVVLCMAVAAFVFQEGKPIADRELAIGYLVGFLAIFFMGSGRFSLDRLSFR